jgi:hypothetical protein
MEVEFYQTLAPEMSCPPLIHCYDAAYSNDTGHSHIILDDHFATHSQPEDNQPPSIENSRLAVAALAAAHAAWWEDARLGTEIGEFFDKEKLSGFVRELSSSVEAFIEHAGDSLTNEQKRAYEKMLASASVIWGRLQSPARLTVTHGDVHWWNFLYPNDPSVDDVYLFDWHLWHLDLGARDLAFLLALGGFAEPRPEIESALLQIYLDTLMKYGVVNYCWDDLQLDYRWSAIRNLNIPVIFRSQGKNESTWRTALRRSWESYHRLGCAELLE